MLTISRRAHSLEFCILHNTRPGGAVIGRLNDSEFSEFVLDEFGRVFVYSGIAPRLSNGRFDDAALQTGEFIVPPGLIYRYRGKAERGLRLF